MNESVYKIVELTGTSKTDMESAIQNAVSRAAETLRNLGWFQVTEIRGLIDKDRIHYWQVTLKVGFNIEEGHEKTEVPDVGLKDKEEPQKGGGGVASKYRCRVCGYIYDPQKGDASQGIKPGTPFEELPDSWKCPECGVPKDQFEKIA